METVASHLRTLCILVSLDLPCPGTQDTHSLTAGVCVGGAVGKKIHIATEEAEKGLQYSVVVQSSSGWFLVMLGCISQRETQAGPSCGPKGK